MNIERAVIGSMMIDNYCIELVKTTKTNNQSSSIDVLKSIELVNTAGMLTHD